MIGASWPEPIATASGETAAAILRQLWLESERVEAAVSDAGRLHDIVSPHRLGDGPRHVRIVCSAPIAVDLPRGWHCTISRRMPAPDLLLFYRRGSSFPDSALVFTGGIGSGAWVTYYRRPFVLHHLQRRFEEVADQDARHPAGMGSIREQPPQTMSSSGASGTAPEKLIRRVAPDELYRQVLAAHFRDAPGAEEDPTGIGPTLAAHQARAFERASGIIDRYGGVIIADAVGLGKTYVGLRLVQRALEEGGRVIVIAPAALREQWERELAYLGVGAPSSPGTPPAPDAPDNLDLWLREDCRIALLSMEALGRRGFDAGAHRGAELVVVDEAHNFRNPATRRYRALGELARHSHIALLTATPINNTLLDLQHLIDLFAAPGAFRHIGISDYRVAFRRAADGVGDVRAIISACVLRRTRRFLRQHYGAVRIRDALSGEPRLLRFPERRPPLAVRYDLAGTYGQLFAGLEDWMEALRFPALDPAAENDDPARPLACAGELLKIILLKRLESSIDAFRATVIQQLAWCNTALRAIDAGRVLTRPDYRASFKGPADDPGGQLAFFELMLPAQSIEPDRLDAFRRALEADLAILARIHSTLIAVGPEGDRKLQMLTGLLDGPLAGRQVLIFTEFRDTGRYLHHQLRSRPFLAQVDSEGARLGLERASRAEVIERFAPLSNNRPPPPARERVDILIATDVLSEGLNLQDASAVVSYDLPWNPVRLMQRIGRIDRLGALHEFVQLHHFVPARDLDRLLGLMARLHGKVSTIQGALGLDQPVLGDSADGRRGLERIRTITGADDGFDRIEAEVEGPFDPEEQAYIDWVDQLKHGKFARPAASVAAAAVTDAGAERPRAVAYWRLTFGTQARGLWLVCDLETGCVTEDQASAIDMLRRARAATRRPPARRLLASARRAFSRYAQGVACRLEAARHAGDRLHPGLPQCRIAAWISRAFTSSHHRLSREQRATMDRLLDRLARRFSAADERSLTALLDELPDRPTAESLHAIEQKLTASENDAGDRVELTEVAILIIVLPPAG